MQLSQVRLLVSDFNACYRFYRDVVGLKPLFGGEGDVYGDFRVADDITFALFDRGMMAEAVGTTSLASSAEAQDRSVVVFAVDDLDSTVANLQERGVKLIAPPTDRPEWGMRTAHFRDPDGNLVEIFVPVPMSEA